VSALVRGELELAKAELAEKGKRAGVGAGLAGAAGLLAGYATASPAQLYFSAAAGLAAVHDVTDRNAVGVPIEAQATWRFLPWVGLGLHVFAVPNKLANYGGISLALDVGRLR